MTNTVIAKGLGKDIKIPATISERRWATDENIKKYAETLKLKESDYTLMGKANATVENTYDNFAQFENCIAVTQREIVKYEVHQIFNGLPLDVKNNFNNNIKSVKELSGENNDIGKLANSVKKLRESFVEILKGKNLSKERADQMFNSLVFSEGQNVRTGVLESAISENQEKPLRRMSFILNTGAKEIKKKGVAISNEGNHFVTTEIVFNKKNPFEISALYQDSFGFEPADNFLASLDRNNEINIAYVEYVQQKDGYNCGRYALLNLINNKVLTNENIEQLAKGEEVNLTEEQKAGLIDNSVYTKNPVRQNAQKKKQKEQSTLTIRKVPDSEYVNDFYKYLLEDTFTNVKNKKLESKEKETVVKKMLALTETNVNKDTVPTEETKKRIAQIEADRKKAEELAKKELSRKKSNSKKETSWTDFIKQQEEELKYWNSVRDNKNKSRILN